MTETHTEAEAFTQTTTHDASELVGETVTALVDGRRTRFVVTLVTALDGGAVYLFGSRVYLDGRKSDRRAGAWLSDVVKVES